MRRAACYNADVTRNRALLAGVILVCVAVAMSVWAYPLLPALVPTHWNASGQINGYSSRIFAASFTPALMALIWLLMLVLPAISPRGFRLDSSAGAFYIAMLAVMALVLVVHVMILRSALTQAPPSLVLIHASIGTLFVVIGSLLGNVKKNFWFGVRTPWTLASDEVWTRTNKLAGRLFLIGGILIVIASFVPSVRVGSIVVIVGVTAVTSIVYSYVVYRRIEGFDSEA